MGLGIGVMGFVAFSQNTHSFQKKSFILLVLEGGVRGDGRRSMAFYT